MGMYAYGHGSWIAVVILVVMFALRAFSSQRRRGMGGPRMGGPGMGGPGRAQGSAFTGGPRSAPPEATADRRSTAASAGGTSEGGIAPGWFTDPFFRHEQRYWSGTEWTDRVLDNGVAGTDPPPVETRDGD